MPARSLIPAIASIQNLKRIDNQLTDVIVGTLVAGQFVSVDLGGITQHDLSKLETRSDGDHCQRPRRRMRELHPYLGFFLDFSIAVM